MRAFPFIFSPQAASPDASWVSDFSVMRYASCLACVGRSRPVSSPAIDFVPGVPPCGPARVSPGLRCARRPSGRRARSSERHIEEGQRVSVSQFIVSRSLSGAVARAPESKSYLPRARCFLCLALRPKLISRRANIRRGSARRSESLRYEESVMAPTAKRNLPLADSSRRSCVCGGTSIPRAFHAAIQLPRAANSGRFSTAANMPYPFGTALSTAPSRDLALLFQLSRVTELGRVGLESSTAARIEPERVPRTPSL